MATTYLPAGRPLSSMPKKTKKEKLLAQKHRTNLLPVVIHHTRETSPTPLPVDTRMVFSLPKRNNAYSAPQSAVVHESRMIKGDLIKTLFLTTAILISELLLAQSLPR